MNRLADQTSPYLRQHADNPVDWHPWGGEAFALARRLDRPVLLSIGYSSCHWCHVMAHESFEDTATAAIMNEHFINVKIDREEHPDVDAVYMSAIQATGARGGWPMTVFTDGDGRPFFGGTYYPPTRRGTMPSFSEVLDAVSDLWTNQREDLDRQATELTDALTRAAVPPSADGAIDVDGEVLLIQATRALGTQYDPEWGGFGQAPKFPQSMNLDALLLAHRHSGDADTLEMVTNSLDAMASGGIYDHLGGGFARYSTDHQWLIPHFEKMLYDNALLARVYLHCWQVTGEERFLQVAEETITYVLRDLRHERGGFFSSEDADSEGTEGKFYAWSRDHIVAVLGDDAAEFCSWYGVTDSGNFEGRNILHRPVRGELSRPVGVELSRQRLFAAREMRIRPGLDDKVLTEWNALMVSALAEGALATANHQWLSAASRAGEFLFDNLRRADGRWLRSWHQDDVGRSDERRPLAVANDLAALVDAFTRLAEASGQRRWIAAALAVADELIELFWDDEGGGLFTTGVDAPALVVRGKDITDSSIPSANSVAAVAFSRLAALSDRVDLAHRAQEIIEMCGPLASQHPTACANLLQAADLASSPTSEIVLVGDLPDLLDVVRRRFLPSTVLAWGEAYESPLWDNRDRGLAYVCHDYACREPTADPDVLARQLDEINPTSDLGG